MSSVSKTSSYKSFSVTLPLYHRNENWKTYATYHNAKYWYNKDVKPHVKCTPGLLAGMVKKSGHFALVAPTRRKFIYEIRVDQYYEIFDPYYEWMTLFYKAYVVA